MQLSMIFGHGFCGNKTQLSIGLHWNTDVVESGCQPGLRDGSLQTSMDVIKCGHGWCGNRMQQSMDINRMWAWSL